MALIKCPKCGREISDKAKKCVGCGWKVEPIKDSTKEQTTKLQHTVAIKKGKRFPDANILFMIVLTIFMICFMVIVWRRLDKFETEIEMVKLSNQTEAEMLINEKENEVEKKLEDNGEQVGLEDKNEKKEISDSDSKDENTVGDNDQQVETEENSKNVVSLNESVNDENYNVEFEYSDNKVTDSYVHIFVKITNKAETAICITSQKYFYINDISIECAFVKVDEEISSGKSALFEIVFERKKIEAAGISTINSLTCQYDIAEKANSENLNSDEITFEGLGININ